MNSTPNANRLHIAIFGRCNSGKSSLINALTGQDTALVSAVPGTTTDLVNKAMEIHGIGPCVFIDTPGFDDEGELGEMRIARTLQAIERTDIALLLCEDGDLEEEQQWIQQLNSRHIPVILILNKSDRRECAADVAARIEKVCGKTPITVSAKEHTGSVSSHPPKTADRFRPTNHYRQLSTRRRLGIAGYATGHTGTQRTSYSASGANHARTAR